MQLNEGKEIICLLEDFFVYERPDEGYKTGEQRLHAYKFNYYIVMRFHVFDTYYCLDGQYYQTCLFS